MAQQRNPTPDPRTAEPRPPYAEQSQSSPGSEKEMSPRPDYGEHTYRGLDRLRERVALVTGGDSGIGRAVCLAFAREGADLAISYLSEEADAQETREVVAREGHRVELYPGDLADPQVCEALVRQTVEKFGRIDVLVNNAAFQGEATEDFNDFTPERLERTFRVNILSMFHLVRAALPHLKQGASIINVASIQAYQPSPQILDYAATKGAIVTFTKGLAQQLTKQGIRVNAVAPGPVWTPLIPASFDKKHVAHFGEDSLLGRPAQPAELAPSFVFLASEESRYVSGEVLGVTGGKLLA